MDKPLNLLLVEDTPADAERIESELQRHGLNCRTRRVETREAFLGELKNFAPHAILADHAVPQFGALEALQILRDLAVDVPLILVTGSPSEDITARCLQEGAEDYVTKSSLRRLPSALRSTLRKRQAERERADTEVALRRSREQYQLIAENTRDLVCLLDLQLHFMYASPSFQLVLGRAAKELGGSDCGQLLHPDDATALREALDEAIFFRESRTVELRLRHAKGNWLTFESAVTCILNEDGQPQRLLVVSRDTSDRKRAEREIRKLAAFPRFNPNPVFEFAADGSLSYFNDAALAMARSLQRHHPQSILPLNAGTIVKMCLSTGQNQLRLDTNVGGRMLSWSFFPVVADQVVHCYAEDITDRLNLEAQLRQAQKMESVGQLAAGLAHDFNNILTVIRGHAGLLTSAPDASPETAESARQISLAADRAANLTRQLLLFSRKQLLQPTLLNLNEVISNLSRMLRSLLGESVTLKRLAADGLPPVHADPGMMEQVLMNLAVNARDAMPRGGTLTLRTDCVELTDAQARRHPEARPGCFVCLSVTDTGHGMDAATAARIFEPFFTTKETGKGTGLGLATVYGIVQQHQGWIEVESQPGRGATFQVFLPVSSRANGTTHSTPANPSPGGHETVLVAEDEPALRDLVQEILQRKGYQVLSAANGAQAMTLWEQHRSGVDLLLTDMMMPGGVSGRELAEHARRDRPDLRVLFTSGYSLDAISPDFILGDGTQFLQKPYEPETLVRAVRDCLNQAVTAPGTPPVRP